MSRRQLPQNQPRPFDQAARDYDREFTTSILGRIYRGIVWDRLDSLFTGKRHILELGCGTGEDALYLVRGGHRVTALDSSEAMIRLARAKLAESGYSEQAKFRLLDLETLAEPGGQQQPESAELPDVYDGVLANFGVLNCVRDLPALARVLHGCLAPGAPALFVIMGPLVPWEWLWFLRKGEPGKSFRRLRRGGAEWRGITIRYPGIRKTRASFSPYFRTRRTGALGTLLPPPYAESWAKAHPGWISRLERLERRWAYSPLVNRLADHFILEMEHI